MEATPWANYGLRLRETAGDNGNVWEGVKMRGGKRSTILVGDVGGTHTRMAIIGMVKGHFNFLAERTFPSREDVLK